MQKTCNFNIEAAMMIHIICDQWSCSENSYVNIFGVDFSLHLIDIYWLALIP
jgi:hypothetical protein